MTKLCFLRIVVAEMVGKENKRRCAVLSFGSDPHLLMLLGGVFCLYRNVVLDVYLGLQFYL